MQVLSTHIYSIPALKPLHVSRVRNLIISYVSNSLISLATDATITDCTFGKSDQRILSTIKNGSVI